MQVSDVIRTRRASVPTTRTDESARRAAHRLSATASEALVVQTPSGRVVGLFSGHDLTEALSCNGVTFDTLGVVDVMQVSVRCCAPDDAIDDVVEIMAAHRQRHVPVVDDGRLVGLVSQGDIVSIRFDAPQRPPTVLRPAYRVAS